ncbi:MAG: hypothetical protein ACE147_21065 [Candidatus Methylomirabilales bacterium]
MTEERGSAGGATPPGRQESSHHFVLLAEAYRREGLLHDAARVLQEGLARWPEVRDAHRLLGRVRAEQGQAGTGPPPPAPGLRLPTLDGEPEPGVLFLDGHFPPGPPVQSPTLAALYASQGDAARAAEIAGALAHRRAAAARLEAWLDGVRDAGGGWLLSAEGGVLAEAGRAGAPPTAGWVGWRHVLEDVRELAELLGWGPPRTLTLVRPGGCEVLGFVADGRAVCLTGGAEALPGELRARARRAALELSSSP